MEASTVTLGRASYTMATTPSGTRMRPTSNPLGRCHWESMAPTGSGSDAT